MTKNSYIMFIPPTSQIPIPII